MHWISCHLQKAPVKFHNLPVTAWAQPSFEISQKNFKVKVCVGVFVESERPADRSQRAAHSKTARLRGYSSAFHRLVAAYSKNYKEKKVLFPNNLPE